MNLNSATKHGIQALVLLARDGSLSTADLKVELGVSRTMIAKVLGQLAKAGIVNSKKGTGGGFRLAKPPAKISMYDIINALQGFKVERHPWYKIMDAVTGALDQIRLDGVAGW